MITPQKRDWKKIVDTSGGRSMFVPDKLVADVKNWQAMRVAFDKEIARVAKLENALSFTFSNLIYTTRNFFEEAGHTDIHTKDVGFNAEALKEGIYIVEITDPIK